MALFVTLASFFLLSPYSCVLSFTPPLHHNSFRRVTTAASQNTNINTSSKTRLFGLAEWRDLDMGFPGTGDDINLRLGATEGGLPKSLCVLPFHYTDVLLQGETKQLRLYEERFIELFQDAMDNHCGVVAMGLIA
jgi:hypothetical protein